MNLHGLRNLHVCKLNILYLFWSCIPAYCTSWVFLVWKSSHRGCLALQPNPAHLHSLLHAAEDPHRNSQSTEIGKHTQGKDLTYIMTVCITVGIKIICGCLMAISIVCDWPPPSPRPAIGCRVSDCMSLCCLASAWYYSDEAQGSTLAAHASLRRSRRCTEEERQKLFETVLITAKNKI